MTWTYTTYYFADNLLSKAERQRKRYRHIQLFYFRKGKNAVHAQNKKCEVIGEDFTER